MSLQHQSNYTTPAMASSTLDVDPAYIILSTVLVIVFILGVAGNGLVIWIAGFKVKKTVNTTWYLSLAVSDFLFCCTLPFAVYYKVNQDWVFGLFMCKFVYFLRFLNMFSSACILVIISVDRCVITMFPVWAKNHRTISKASVMVILVWIISVVLSTPSLVFPNIDNGLCYFHYRHHQDVVAQAVCQFVFGFLVPLVIVIICYSNILKINCSACFKKKTFMIMTALIAVFFICWLPFHIYDFMELNYDKYGFNTLILAYTTGFALASANSCVNPFIYAFVGRGVHTKWYGFPSKIENAFAEEDEDQNRV